MNVRPLPLDVQKFLAAHHSPDKLITHLQLVHDTCCRLLDGLNIQFPHLSLDHDMIRFGAAIHDAGKILHQNEIDGPGHRHEEDGPELLIANGFKPECARFAQTHGAWETDRDLNLEDLLVALSDAVWKGSRIDTLETLVAQAIAAKTGLEEWDVYLKVDTVLSDIARRGDERLSLQSRGREAAENRDQS